MALLHGLWGYSAHVVQEPTKVGRHFWSVQIGLQALGRVDPADQPDLFVGPGDRVARRGNGAPGARLDPWLVGETDNRHVAAMVAGDRELAMAWIAATAIEGVEQPDPYQIALLEATIRRAADLAERLAAAAYPVIAFSAADLQSEPQPDLAVRALAALVRQLNQDGRAALLPSGQLGGNIAHFFCCFLFFLFSRLCIYCLFPFLYVYMSILPEKRRAMMK